MRISILIFFPKRNYQLIIMANMLRANQAGMAIYKPKGLIVYGECNRCLLASVDVAESFQAFPPGGPIGSIKSFQCQFCHCHQNDHRRLDVNHHQLQPPPTQQVNFIRILLKS